jgi:hypothetical protein
MQDPLSQEVRLSPAVAQSFDQLHPAVLALALGGTPRRSQSRLDRCVVFPEAPGHPLERFDTRLSCLLEPGVQCGEVTLADNSVEPFLEPVALGQHRVGFQEMLQVILLSTGQLLAGA